MTSPLTSRAALSTSEAASAPTEAQPGAAAFLARYGGRTLQAYRFARVPSSSGSPITASTL